MTNTQKDFKQPVVTVTAKDCRFDYIRGSGAGGQKRNKTSSAVRCTHLESGAVGYCEESRSQHDNKRTAFVRMANTQKFRNWLQLETSRRTGEEEAIYRRIEQEMKNIRVEIKVDGKWTEVDKNDTLEHTGDDENNG